MLDVIEMFINFSQGMGEGGLNGIEKARLKFESEMLLASV